MQRADMAMVLNEANNLGDTLLKNRVMAQQDKQNTADRDLRKQEMGLASADRETQANNLAGWRTQQQDQSMLQNYLKANADGSLDDDGRAKANQWISAHPYFGGTGMQLVKPPKKEVGTMETSQTRNHAELKKLQEQIRTATTPEEKAQAEQDLADFRTLLPGRAEKT